MLSFLESFYRIFCLQKVFSCCFTADMPRYCAVKFCPNRGGTASRKDSKRISFYPFPLHDKPRLQKWVDNIKREDWTPSRHQFLCNEHFTEDCFDIRWGIRYLKNTAIPTPVSLVNDDGEKEVTTSERSLKSKRCSSDTDAELRESEPPSTKRPLILRKACRQIEANIDKNVSEHLKETFEPPVVPASEKTCQSGLPETHTSICEATGGAGRPTASSHVCEPGDSVVAVLCCETLKAFSWREANKDPVALQAAPGQTFQFVPLEVVEETSAHCFVEETGPGEEMHISLYEHSYSRPDVAKDEMWNQIWGLRAKILELDRREEKTVAKIRALENEIVLLKKDGAIFREKQKILENYISSVVL